MYSDINVPVARLYGVETDTDDERELQRQLFGGLAGRLWTVDNQDHLKSEERNQHERSTPECRHQFSLHLAENCQQTTKRATWYVGPANMP